MLSLFVLLLPASSGAVTLRVTHLSRVSSQTSGPVPPAALMLLMKALSWTRSSYSKVGCFRIPGMTKHSAIAFVSLLVIPAGRRVWAYSGYNPVQGYPKKLSSFGLPRGVRKIDAALYDVNSGKVLFFVGKYYFR